MAVHTTHHVATTVYDSHGKKGMDKLDEEAPDSGVLEEEESAVAMESESGPSTGSENHEMESMVILLEILFEEDTKDKLGMV